MLALTVAEALQQLVTRFAAAGVPTPRVDAELLIGHVLGWPRSRVRLHLEAVVPEAAAEELAALAARRAQREPLQLLVGVVGFRFLDLEVRPGVFIPRPETEVLAGLAIERTPDGGIVVEPCTGTAAVACSVALEASPGMVVATDVSPEAVALARDNVARLEADVTVFHGDLLDPLPESVQGRIDVLVCNPPYVAAGEIDGLEPEVVDWDPREALVSGDTGHEVSDRLIATAQDWLAPRGWLLLEVDAARAAETAARMRAAGLIDVAVERDLTGRDRFAVGRRRST